MAPFSLGKTIKYILLIFFALLFLMPVYVIIVTSLKPLDEVSLEHMWALPTSIDFSSYVQAVKELAPNFMNSVYLVIPATLLSALLGAMNGYVLSKWKVKGLFSLFTIILFDMLFPSLSILSPMIQFMCSFVLYVTIEELVLVHVVYRLSLSPLMFRNIYANIPY